jgi:hypothetical protein
MGLDMYLTKKTCVKNWSYNAPKDVFKITVKKGGKPFKNIDVKKIVYIEEEAGYWRKANMIHNWFVDNVQDGKDDCRDYYVDISKLEELLRICKQVSKNHSVAEELLPSKSGFFFGDTDYDEWYYKDVEETIKLLEDILTKEGSKEAEYYYRSSW